MKLEDVLLRIVQQRKLIDSNYSTIALWCIQNKDDPLIADIISSIQEEKLTKGQVKAKGGNIIEVNKLEHSDFLIPLANSFNGANIFDKSIELFEHMEKKGCNESTMLNDYGAVLLRQMLSSRSYDKEKWEHARQLIFRAFDFDKKVSKDCYKFPAYKNLCYLRAVEASFYLQQNDSFAAFLLAWMSIEMTLTGYGVNIFN